MNILIVVVPVLILLMFCLGLELRARDFTRLAAQPGPVAIGLAAQLLGLPVIAASLAWVLGLPPVAAVGLILLAACPGGASSNAFTMLARGDVALSVSLTAVTSVVTVVTIPLVVNTAMSWWQGADAGLSLAVGPVLGQNTVTILLPIGLGMAVRSRRPHLADRLLPVLRRAALPLLLLMIVVFVIRQRAVLAAGLPTLAGAVTLLILVAMGLGSLLGRAARLATAAQRAILIEVGMQNAAQAIAIAASPLLLGDAAYAVPAVVYAVVMNFVLLGYLGWVRAQDGRAMTATVRT
jgi:bile acid:Na+ symporter, BASS family